jgi:hypothetical protein
MSSTFKRILPGPVFVGLLAITASLVANAQAGAGAQIVEDDGSKKTSWVDQFRGTFFSYGHYGASNNIDTNVGLNPTWYHRFGLLPQWNYKKLFVRARWFFSQEFTISDTTKYRHEIEMTDILLDVGTSGFKDPNSGIRIAGDLRFALPTSKTSLAQTRVLTIGPSVNVSRSFPVLSGLTLAYATRFTYRFNRKQTPQFETPSLPACGAAASDSCAEFLTNGVRGTNFDINHGPALMFSPHERVSIAASYFMFYLRMYPPARVPDEFADAQGLQGPTGPDWRYFNLFNLSVDVQLIKAVSLSAGAFTFTGQLGEDGRYLNPFFNRYTTVFLELGLDFEAAMSSFVKKS